MPVPVLTVAQMRAWEEQSWEKGRSQNDVIERVGQLLAQRALELTRPDDRILIVAGKGHNGDDARCAQPHLADRKVALLRAKNPAEVRIYDEPQSHGALLPCRATSLARPPCRGHGGKTSPRGAQVALRREVYDF